MAMLRLKMSSDPNSEQPAHTLITSNAVPDIFARGASMSSERIHFHASRKASSGNRNDARPKVCSSRSETYDPGYPMRLRGRAEATVFHEGSWVWYDTRLSRITMPSESSRNPVTSLNRLCCVGDMSFITLAGG